MVTASGVTSGAPARRNFTLYFILLLGVISAITFYYFTAYARSSVEHRKEINRSNLAAIGAALKKHALDERLPADLPAGTLPPQTFTNPSWPEQAGYMLVTGVRLTDAPETILVFENTPPAKRKLGRHVLTLDGRIEVVSEDRLQERLDALQFKWKAESRPWRVSALFPNR